MTEQDRLLEAQKLFQSVRAEADVQEAPQNTPCGKPCVPLILQDQAIKSINKRLEAGDRALDAIPLLVEEMKAIKNEIKETNRALRDELKETNDGVSKTKEIVEAWGNIKGLAVSFVGISTALKVATPIVLFFGFIYLMFYNPQLAMEKARLWLGAR